MSELQQTRSPWICWDKIWLYISSFRRNLKVRRFIFRELPFKDKFRKENRLLRCTKFHRCSVSHNFKLHHAKDEGTGHLVPPGLTSNRRFEYVNIGCLIWTRMLWIFALANEWDQSNLNSVPFCLVISRLVISDSEHLHYSLCMYCITLSHCTFNTCISPSECNSVINFMTLIISNIITRLTCVLILLNYKIVVCLHILDFKMYTDWF